MICNILKKSVFKILLLTIIGCTFVACDDTLPTESTVSYISDSVTDVVQINSETHTRIVSTLNEMSKADLENKFAEAESNMEISLKDYPKYIPVLLAQTDNIKNIILENRRIGDNDTTGVWFYTDEQAFFSNEPVDVEGYKVFFVSTVYNVKMDDYCSDVTEGQTGVTTTFENGNMFMYVDDRVYEDHNYRAFICFEIDETTCCGVSVLVENKDDLTKEFVQQLKDDFICKPLSEL